MKYLKAIFLSTLITLAFAACGDSNSNHHHDGDATEHHDDAMHHDGDAMHHHGEGAAYNSEYVCPMHCEGSGSDEPGTCPVCGMDYVKHDDHVEDGHTH